MPYTLPRQIEARGGMPPISGKTNVFVFNVCFVAVGSPWIFYEGSATGVPLSGGIWLFWQIVDALMFVVKIIIFEICVQLCLVKLQVKTDDLVNTRHF